ncbi:lipid II flippase Amj family protein [Clostridium sp. 19966]|uniref:lipid II flippase Amj family protein n=1 Tax=Clostridium sp. 19966 TaxID=2768166 RepID=UPI0028E019B6|nr:lipid II flippase Amj family protein [Clostridium sp. 19966]MDT8717552.1 lipid II flippase Amj family protein [Clostridium sp. 19966]
MSLKIIIVIVLTFLISLIGILAYAAKVVGVKTRRIAITASVFNILALISRTATTIQAPLLTSKVEQSINSHAAGSLVATFRIMLLASTAGTILGALFMPTFIKLFSRAVESFNVHRSIPRLVFHGFSKSGMEQFKNSLSLPKRSNMNQLKDIRRMPKKIILFNALAYSLSSVGSYAALYAACLAPEIRTTCSTLSPVINGFATILMFVFIDPFLSLLTDDVVRGDCSELHFNRCITFIMAGMIAGTIISQIILVPGGIIISYIAKLIA